MKKVLVTIMIVIMGAIAFFSRMPAGILKAESGAPIAKGYVLMSESGEVLKGKNENERLPVASMVKTMTLLLIFEEIEKGVLDIESKVVASDRAAGMGGSQVFIESGTEYKIDDLIKSIVVASGNDASVLLAETISGTEEDFVARMNERAKELGLENTNFENSTGLPSANGYSSARDMAKIMCELKKHTQFFGYAKIWLDKIEHSGGRITELANTNKMIRQYDKCIGGKTGSTDAAGFCVSSVARDGDFDLIAVVVGSPTSKERFDAAKQLFNYGFANFENRSIVKEGDVFAAPVGNCRQKEMNVVAQESYSAVMKKGEKSDFATQVVAEQLRAPIKAQTETGHIDIIKNGEVVAKVGLFAQDDMEAISFLGSFGEVVDNFLN